MSQRWFNRHDEAGFEINSDRVIWQLKRIARIYATNFMQEILDPIISLNNSFIWQSDVIDRIQ